MTTLEKYMAQDTFQEHELHTKGKYYDKHCSSCYTIQQERIMMFHKGRADNNNFKLAGLEKLNKDFRTS